MLLVAGDNKSTLENLDIVFISEALANIKGDHPSLLPVEGERETLDVDGSAQTCLHKNQKSECVPYKWFLSPVIFVYEEQHIIASHEVTIVPLFALPSRDYTIVG